MKLCFIDSNVVVYANDRNANDKQERAIDTISCLMEKNTGVVSIQVLQEYANVALTKLHQESSVVVRQLKLLESCRFVTPTAQMVRRSVEICTTYQVAFWDAGIIAAAETADCDAVLSEDLNTGQYYAGIQVINPFTPDFEIPV